MKKFLIAGFFIVLWCTSILHAQRQYTQWCFGVGGGLDFNSGVPVPFTSSLQCSEGSSSIADPVTGQLLFYTDGVTVYNANHQAMPNGTGLLGGPSSTQAALIVKCPGQNSLFYIFTTDWMLYYSIVDMSLQSGLGDVTSTKNVLLSGSCTEKLTAGLHANGIDIWVLAHESGSNHILSYLLSATGLNTIPVVSAGGNIDGGSGYGIGQMKMNEQDTQVVMTGYLPALDLFSFDNSNGTLIYRYSLDLQNYTYGAGFSPNGRLLYTMRQTSSGFDIAQYDLSAGNAAAVIASKYIVTNYSNCFGSIQLGPDNKLYTPDSGSPSISVVNYPDVYGSGCNFIQSGVALAAGATAQLGLPQAFYPVDSTVIIPPPPPDTVICFEDLNLDTVFPNVFTPNGDQANDNWQASADLPAINALTIYDRWGAVVFHTESVIQPAWNGQNANGNYANAGVYYWMIEFTSDCTGKKYTRTGFLELIK